MAATAIIWVICFARSRGRLHFLLRHQLGTEQAPVVTHAVFQLTLNVCAVRILGVERSALS